MTHTGQPEGRIEVITGCMFSGKTMEVIRRLRRADIAGQEIAVFSPAIDNRYGREEIGTHNGESWEATVVDTTQEGAERINRLAEDAEVVAIDEFNFFDQAAVPVVRELARDGKQVIVAGIDQTFRGDPFEPVNRVMAFADEIEKLNAVCEVCGGRATMTQRLDSRGNPAPADEPTVQVSGDDSYEARCRDCHELGPI